MRPHVARHQGDAAAVVHRRQAAADPFASGLGVVVHARHRQQSRTLGPGELGGQQQCQPGPGQRPAPLAPRRRRAAPGAVGERRRVAARAAVEIDEQLALLGLRAQRRHAELRQFGPGIAALERGEATLRQLIDQRCVEVELGRAAAAGRAPATLGQHVGAQLVDREALGTLRVHGRDYAARPRRSAVYGGAARSRDGGPCRSAGASGLAPAADANPVLQRLDDQFRACAGP